ncbi:hypothetical protein AB0C02_30495 [Micromonospora sp. NPDC048999]|uniref:hypothetical protein n=1 Tax=Micromonospora sp. NPDC048999 TaxID=3155391 RepID=UPI0033C30B8F
MSAATNGDATSTRDKLLAALLAERYGAPPLPRPAPPHPVERALAARAEAPQPPPARRRHLVVHPGGSTTTAAA